jgi:CRISPR-associated protein Csx17
MTQDPAPQAVQHVLIAIGEAAAYLASSPKARDPKEGNQKPPPHLSSAWFDAANDGSAEFRMAAALAGLGRESRRADVDEARERLGEDLDASAAEDEPEGDAQEAADQAVPIPVQGDELSGRIPPPPFRAHLAPLDENTWYSRRREWSDEERLTAWGAGALDRNLIAVLERRLLFAAQRNLEGGPFVGRPAADLASVLTFHARETDDAKISALAQGLAWADAPSFIREPREENPGDRPALPLSYALLKPFFASTEQLRELGVLREGAMLPVPTGLVWRLRSGDVGVAVALACRRARASGLPMTFEPRAEHVAHLDGRRLLASLLVPVRTTDLKRVLKRAYPALFEDKEAPQPEEDPAHAA